MAMQWKTKKRRYTDYKVVKRFALFPVTCKKVWDDRVDTETRWLQTVYILKEWHSSWGEGWWFNKRFCTEEEYLMFLEEEAMTLAEER